MSDVYRIPLRFRISRPILKVVFQGLYRVLGRVTISGKHSIPRDKPCVVAMNHVSIFDPPFAAAFWPGPLEVIGAIDVFDKPGQGQLLRDYGVIPVHRGDYDRVLLSRMVKIIQAGYPLLIAPEGARSHDPAMRRAKPGVAYIVENSI